MSSLSSPGVLVSAPTYVSYTHTTVEKTYPVISGSLPEVPANNKPTSTNNTIVVNENSSVFLIPDSFGIYFDSDGDLLNSVKITELPLKGLIEILIEETWSAITLNQEIAVSVLSSNSLRYTPILNESGNSYTQFKYKVNDGTDYSDSEYIITVNVTYVATYPSDSIFMVDLNPIFSNSNLNTDLANEVYTSIKSFCDIPYNSSAHTSEIMFVVSNPASGGSDILNLLLTQSVNSTFSGSFNTPLEFTNYYSSFTHLDYLPHVNISSINNLRYYYTWNGSGILKIDYTNSTAEMTDYNRSWLLNSTNSGFYSLKNKELNKKSSSLEYTTYQINTSTSSGVSAISNNNLYYFGYTDYDVYTIPVSIIDLNTNSSTLLNSSVNMDNRDSKYFSYWFESNQLVYGDKIYWSGGAYYDTDNWFQNIVFYIYDIPTNTCKLIHTNLDSSSYYHMRYIVRDNNIYFITNNELICINTLDNNSLSVVASFTSYTNEENNQSRKCTSLGVDSMNNIICTHFVNNYQSSWSC